MLDAIEFQAKIQNGLIEIPAEYQQKFSEGDDIKVIVLVCWCEGVNLESL